MANKDRSETDFTNIRCHRCGRGDLNSNNAHKEKDKGISTGKWLCKKCYNGDYIKRPDSQWNLFKSVGDCRSGNQTPNSSQEKGDKFEELTCVWRGVKSLNKENDNYCFPIDHSRDLELGIIQTKGKFYDSYNQIWEFGNFRRDHNKDFNVMICYCTNKNGTIIERIYIFPKKELINRNSITITKFPLRNSDTLYWYEKYRVTDEEVLKKVNEIWTNYKKKKKGIAS